MNLLLTIISFSLLLSQQLQVDGNLKVTGEIDAQGQAIKNVGTPQAVTDALNLQTLNNMMTDDVVYEYNYFSVYFPYYNSTGSLSGNYKEYGGDNSFTSGWLEKLNELSVEGWILHNTFKPSVNSDTFIFMLKRPLEQE